MLKKPRNIKLSYLISKQIIQLNYLLPALFFASSYVIIENFFENFKEHLLIVVLVCTALAKIFSIIVLKFLKKYLSEGFKITMLRSFRKSEGFRNEILPAIGCYGKLSMISDTEFLTTRLIGDEENATNILSEYYIHDFSDDVSWQEQVHKFLIESNLIVFYLYDLPTENIYWELNKVIELGKEELTIIIAEDHIREQLQQEQDFANLKFVNHINYSFNSGFKTHFKKQLEKIYLR